MKRKGTEFGEANTTFNCLQIKTVFSQENFIPVGRQYSLSKAVKKNFMLLKIYADNPAQNLR